MKVACDFEMGILYMHFRDGLAEDGVMVEFDKGSEVMGVELWGIRKTGVLKELTDDRRVLD